MKGKLITIGAILAAVYIATSLTNTFFGRTKSEPHLFELEKLQYVAKWFHLKKVKKVVSSRSLSNLGGPFKQFEIKLQQNEDYENNHIGEQLNIHESKEEDSEPYSQPLIDLNLLLSTAKRTSSKGVFIDDFFEASDKNMKLFQNFIGQKGFIYIGAPSQIRHPTKLFIRFLIKSIKSGSISIMYFEKMATKSGSTMRENLAFLKEYKKDAGNMNSLIEKLNK